MKNHGLTQFGKEGVGVPFLEHVSYDALSPLERPASKKRPGSNDVDVYAVFIKMLDKVNQAAYDTIMNNPGEVGNQERIAQRKFNMFVEVATKTAFGARLDNLRQAKERRCRITALAKKKSSAYLPFRYKPRVATRLMSDDRYLLGHESTFQNVSRLDQQLSIPAPPRPPSLQAQCLQHEQTFYF